MSKTAIIIPARFTSSRFPGKCLEDLHGRTIVQHVYLRALQVRNADTVIVATDHYKVAENIESIGGQAVITKKPHENGTSRIAEVAETLAPDYKYIVNLQGDEPLIEPQAVEALIDFIKTEGRSIATLKIKISELGEVADQNVVKVVGDEIGKALYFSRCSVPYQQDSANAEYYKHIGVYAFRRKTLHEVVKLKPGKLEKAERLEQLRWMEHDYDIHVLETEHDSVSIDVPEDLEHVRKILVTAR